MEATEIRKLAAFEDSHWWYAERRALLARRIRDLSPGKALDIGAAGGGNTRVLRRHGWIATALEYGEEGAIIARERGLSVVRADACQLPVMDRGVDLVVAFDVLEHIGDDVAAAAEIHRVLSPGGTALIAVPADPALWSAHDEAVGHVRRYTARGLRDLLEATGLVIDSLESWNVLLRPVAVWRRRRATGSDLTQVNKAVNAALRAIVATERFLPVQSRAGVSLIAHARRA